MAEPPKLSWLQDENQENQGEAAAADGAGMSTASAPAEGEAVAPTMGAAGMMPGMMMPGMMPGMMMPGMGMPGMLPGMANPMMMMMQNPAMMAMMMGGGGAAALAGMTGMEDKPMKKVDTNPIDPRVLTLCRDFNIEDRLMRKLNDVMMRRPDTFEDDINTVRQRLSKERPDIGVLITQLDRGIFVTKANIHPDMKVLVDKYNLDDRATQRLVESMRKRRKTMNEDLKALDVRLSSAERPSGLLMTLLQGLDTTGKLPAPPKSLGLPGSYGGREPEEKRDRRSRDRDRDKRRSRSRSRRRRD